MKITEYEHFGMECTACQACAQACPVNAIEMKFQKDGFLYPCIDEQNCVNCGICAKVCPLTQPKKTMDGYIVFSVQAKEEEILKKSSSGGVFPLIAAQVIKHGGLVIGAAFDAKSKQVCHRTSDEVSLEALMRSKYVQSNIDGAYGKAAAALKQGRRVLFCGTPCQVRGLQSFLALKHISGDLLTIDFMCHGVPSPGFYKSFLTALETEKQSKIIDISFREKDLGWRKQISKAYFEDGQVWTQESGKHYYYYYYFLQNFSLRDSCYKCDEYNAHTADLTLADDWISSLPKDDRGTSLAFLNTLKGKMAFEEISLQLNINDVTGEFSSLEVYGHKKYDYSKKAVWNEALNTKGFDYVSGPMYRKIAKKDGRQKLITTNLNRAKRLIKKVLPIK